MGVLVFDTGPLSHLAREQWFETLKAVVDGRGDTAVITDVVEAELVRGLAKQAELQVVLDASWIGRVRLDSDRETASFAKFASLLVQDGRNEGEASVLAYADANGATAVVDDGAARGAAARHRVAKLPTLALLCGGIRDGLLTVPIVSALADDLIAGSYRLPFPVGGFAAWAADNGLV